MRAFKGYVQSWYNVILTMFILLVKAVTTPVHTEVGGEGGGSLFLDGVTLQKSRWDRRYCCDHLRKLQSAALSNPLMSVLYVLGTGLVSND